MIVLAESNFVLELALQQEQSKDVEHLVSLAETRQIELVIPACAFTEPYQTLIRRRQERKQLIRAVQQSFKQVGRSRGLQELVASSDETSRIFAKADAAERHGLGEAVDRLMRCCRIQVLSDVTLRTAYDFESEFDLEPHDAVVLASIGEALRERTGTRKLFVNKDAKDFVTPKIEGFLGDHGCKLITNFGDARQIAENEASRSTH